ncbi:MAG TPA: hypothetical protein VK789_28330 [Bryobacteraceae bacterium]|jgi:hypothetical protein|nr:hypothetical protein [Bryobacteraceae bacterium]
MWETELNGERVQIPDFVRCNFDDPVSVRFPVASDGQHYPVFDLATQQVIYTFDPPSTAPVDFIGRGLSVETLARIRQHNLDIRRSNAARKAWATRRQKETTAQ